MKEYLKQLIIEAIQRLQFVEKLQPNIQIDKVQVERSNNPEHGEYYSNAAMVLAKSTGLSPRKFAELVVEIFPQSPNISRIDIAGAGFINFFLSETAQQGIVTEVLKLGSKFGQCNLGKNKKVIVEFVSANPTGPLHVGHGRGAIYGSVVSNLLETCGYEVHREYYVNDAGRQMNILTISLLLRYLEIYDELFSFPTKGYKGQYIRDIAEKIKAEYGDKFKYLIKKLYKNVSEDASQNEIESEDEKIKKIADEKGEAHIDGLIKNAKNLLGNKDYNFLHDFGLNKVLDDIKEDLEEFGIHFQEWFSEKSLMVEGAIKKGIEALRDKDYIYEKDGASWFRSTDFGDEKNRVLIRANGQTTYFASDVAYHWNKLRRGFDEVIDVFGADHHGYVPRVRAAMQALGLNPRALRVPLVQFATLWRGKERVQMSTRSGKFITLRQLREEIGNSAARFFYIMQKADQHMNFDLELALSQKKDNPVYYVQYAHTRICSVFRQLTEKGWLFDDQPRQETLLHLTGINEKSLLACLARYPVVIKTATQKLDPHLLANYLHDLAYAFHKYYDDENKDHRILVENENIRHARLCLSAAVRQVLVNGLTLIGVSAPETM